MTILKTHIKEGAREWLIVGQNMLLVFDAPPLLFYHSCGLTDTDFIYYR
jgi:hypothetical protein